MTVIIITIFVKLLCVTSNRHETISSFKNYKYSKEFSVVLCPKILQKLDSIIYLQGLMSILKRKSCKNNF